MPVYAYQCKECDETFEIRHRMGETVHNCQACGAESSLVRVPAMFSVTENKQNKSTAKQRVDEFISSAKQELKEHQQDSRKEYEP